MVLCRRLVMVLAVALAFVAVMPAQAQLTLFTNRGAFAGDDWIDWRVLGPEYAFVSENTSLLSAGSLGVTVSTALGGGMERRDQGSSWGGNFSPGDRLLWTRDPGQGPLTLDFASLVWGAGAQIQADYLGAFTGVLEAFDGSGVSLGSFSVPGYSTSGNGSAIFIGVRSTSADIKKVVFSLSSAESDLGDFTINQTDLVRNGEPVPEAGTLAALAGFLSSGALMVLRRRRVV